MKSQEEIVDELIVEELEVKYPGFKEKLAPVSKFQRRKGILSLLDTNRALFEDYKKVAASVDNYFEYADEIVMKLREYVKVADTAVKTHGEVMTPIPLVEEMLDKLPAEVWTNPELKWLDPCNGVGTFPSVIVKRLMKGLENVIPNPKKRYRHIIEEMIYVCELQVKNMFIYNCVFDREDIYELNEFCGSFLSKEFDEHMRNEWRIEKFDIMIGNPPYTNGLDLKFLQKAHGIADSILFVQPSTWLIDEKGMKKSFRTTKNLIGKDLESIELFNGNEMFGIGLFVPCVVTYFNKNRKTKGIYCIDKINNVTVQYDNIDSINKWSDAVIYPRLKNKILEAAKVDNLDHHWENQIGKFFVNFSCFRGHPFNDDFYTVVTKDAIVDIERAKTMSFTFQTSQEAENCLKYLKTRFCMFCLSIYKINQHLENHELAAIPWLDFTQEWTDEKLYKHFALTPEEIDFIEKKIPKYY